MAPRHVAGSDRASTDTGSVGVGVDRFESPGGRGRIGVHRIVAAPKRFWVYLVSALIGIAVLTGAGVAGVMVTGANLTTLFEAQRQEPAPEPAKVQPALDPAASVVVLNGTPMPGFGSIVDGVIADNQWGSILFSADAVSNEVQTSAVFYSSPDDEAAALGLAEQIGGIPTIQSDDYAEYEVRLVVLLGADYSGPGSEQLVLE